MPPKQRHTALRILERLKAEHGHAGGYTGVRDYVRIANGRLRETFVPLVHPTGHAQVDFGEAIGIIGCVRQKLHVFFTDLPHSDAPFIKAYPAETTEAFLDVPAPMARRSRGSSAITCSATALAGRGRATIRAKFENSTCARSSGPARSRAIGWLGAGAWVVFRILGGSVFELMAGLTADYSS